MGYTVIGRSLGLLRKAKMESCFRGVNPPCFTEKGTVLRVRVAKCSINFSPG